MRLLTNPTISWDTLPDKITLQTGEYLTIHDLSASEVDSVALIGSSLENCSVEHSIDNVVWVEAITGVVATKTGVLVTFTKVVGAKHWRVKNLGSVGYGKLLYVGISKDIKSPVYPSQIVKEYNSTDKETLGGISYSKVHYSSYIGRLTLNYTDVGEIAFREMFEASKGFRIPFILEHKSSEVYVFTSTDKYPLQKMASNVWKGAMVAKEVL